MKKIPKKLIGIIAGAATGIIVLIIAGILIFRVDGAKAQNIALNQTGGGDIVSQEVENEGLLNEYKYTIVNGDAWYEIEIGGFGRVKELEAGVGHTY